MIDGADLRQSRSIESRARRVAKEISGAVHLRLETGAGLTWTLALMIQVRRDIARKRVPREASLVIRTRLARLARRAEKVGRARWAKLSSRAFPASLARLD